MKIMELALVKILKCTSREIGMRILDMLLDHPAKPCLTVPLELDSSFTTTDVNTENPVMREKSGMRTNGTVS